MKIAKPRRALKPSDTCLWLENGRIQRPDVRAAVVLEANGETIRLVAFGRTGGFTIHSGVLPYGHPRMYCEDGTISPMVFQNGCWFLPDEASDTLESLCESCRDLKTELNKLRKRVAALEKVKASV